MIVRGRVGERAAAAAALRSAVGSDTIALTRLSLATSLAFETQGDTNQAAVARLASGIRG